MRLMRSGCGPYWLKSTHLKPLLIKGLFIASMVGLTP